jgi:hypothetical protein
LAIRNGFGKSPDATILQSVAGETGMIAGTNCAKRIKVSVGDFVASGFCCIFMTPFVEHEAVCDRKTIENRL